MAKQFASWELMNPQEVDNGEAFYLIELHNVNKADYSNAWSLLRSLLNKNVDIDYTLYDFDSEAEIGLYYSDLVPAFERCFTSWNAKLEKMKRTETLSEMIERISHETVQEIKKEGRSC